MKIDLFRSKKGWILWAFILLINFSACKYSNSPESVAKKFLISFNQLDITTAKSLSTPSTWDFLDIMGAATKNISDERKKDLGANFTVEILNVAKESDSTVIVTFKTNPKRLPFNQFRLVKTQNNDGDTRWKVDISTLDLLNSDSTNILPQPGSSPSSADTSKQATEE